MTKGLPVLFCFSGQGSQYPQMGAGLYRTEPVFRDTLDRLGRIAREVSGLDVVGRIFDQGSRKTDPFDDVSITNPAILMIELALSAMMRDRGVLPDAVLGASLGEFAAAVTAGVMSDETAVRLVCGFSGAVAEGLPGGMLAILESPDLHDREPALRDGTEIAGLNGPRHFIVTGPSANLDAAEAALSAQGVLYQRIAVRHAFHSRLMDPLRDGYLDHFRAVALAAPDRPLFSCASRGRVGAVTAEHFWRVVRDPIDFAATLGAVESLGAHVYLDLGPSGVLHNHVRGNLRQGSQSRSLPLLSPFADDRQLLERVLATVPASKPEPRQVSVGERKMKVYGFPGQGSQVKGMGADLFPRFPDLVATADAILGYSITDLCLNDPDGRLRQTRFTQPALFVVEALTFLARTADGAPPPDYLAGHSLGEYVALFAAGAFDFATGLDLVRQRADAMSRASGGGMAAVVGCDIGTVAGILADAGLTGLDIAGHNSPNQVVLAGPSPELERARPVFEGRKAGFFPLNVSAPFHSRYMADAGALFRKVLEKTSFQPLRYPVIANVDARPHRPETLREGLARQIVCTVQWVDTVRYLMAKGDVEFEEMGPGTVLTRTVAAVRKSLPPLDLTAEPEVRPASPGEWAPTPAPAPFPFAAPVAAPVPTPAPAPAPATGPAASVPSPSVVLPQASIPAPAAAAPSQATLAPVVPVSPVSSSAPASPVAPVFPVAPAVPGSRSLQARYGLRLPCVAGSLYGGISGRDMILRLSRAGLLGVLGTGGLPLAGVESLLRAIRAGLGPDRLIAANLLYEARPDHENRLIALYLDHGVRMVEASGFLALSPALVTFRLKGGSVLAKVSSLEMARTFLQPPPPAMLRRLVESGGITEEEAARGARLPVATEICVEGAGGWLWSGADLSSLLPAAVALRDGLNGARDVPVGAAGGLGTPMAVRAAEALGAEFILVGSVTQCTVEAETSPAVKDRLQGLSVDDCDVAPFGPLFEFGIRARMLKKGVFFPARMTRLYELWRAFGSWEAIPQDIRQGLSPWLPGGSFEAALTIGRRRLQEIAPESFRLVDETPKGRFATVAMAYFDDGFARARAGGGGRVVDHAVFTGPALGAFNLMVEGTALEPWRSRHVDLVIERVLGADGGDSVSGGGAAEAPARTGAGSGSGLREREFA